MGLPRLVILNQTRPGVLQIQIQIQYSTKLDQEHYKYKYNTQPNWTQQYNGVKEGTIAYGEAPQKRYVLSVTTQLCAHFVEAIISVECTLILCETSSPD